MQGDLSGEVDLTEVNMVVVRLYFLALSLFTLHFFWSVNLLLIMVVFQRNDKQPFESAIQ
jgi:hypothetical protein